MRFKKRLETFIKRSFVLIIMEQEEIRPNKVKRFIKETFRVLRITKKPNQEEYRSLVKVTAIGIAIVGVIGFVIFLFKELLFV